MDRRLALLALLLLVGCAHRYPVRAGGDREAVAGLAVELGSATEPVPVGTRIRWDFGDGQSQEGPTARHVWARAGEYKLKLQVTDEKGAREDTIAVHVARRPPAAAVPPSARVALIFDRFFARLPQHLALAERLAGPEKTRDILGTLEQGLGFDPARPEQVLASGFDPEEGLALVWLPNDAGTWIIVGIFDEQAALDAARSALSKREQVTFAPGPSGSTIAKVGTSRLLLAATRGYLYVHLGGDDDAAPAWESILAAPAEGLFADAAFAKARLQLLGDDARVFVRGSELPTHKALAGDAATLRDHTTALAASFSNQDTELTAQARVFFDAEGEATLAKAFASSQKSDLDTRAPAGAVGYLSLSLAADTLAGWLKGSDRHELDGALDEASGLDLEALASLSSGGAAVAAYFDLAALMAELVGDHRGSRFKVVSALTLKDPKVARARFDEAEKQGRLKTTGENHWELAATSEPTDAALIGAQALFGHRPLLDRTLDPKESKHLAETLRAALPAEALAPGHQLLYADVGTLIDQLRKPTPSGALDAPGQQQMALMMAAVVEAAPELRPLLPLKDFYLDVFKDGAALALRARVRFR